MFSIPEKGRAVLMYAETKSIVDTQRRFRNTFQKEAPSNNSIKTWYELMWNTGSLQRKKRTVNENEILDKAELIQECVQETPSISVRKTSSDIENIFKIGNISSYGLFLSNFDVSSHQDLR